MRRDVSYNVDVIDRLDQSQWHAGLLANADYMRACSSMFADAGRHNDVLFYPGDYPIAVPSDPAALAEVQLDWCFDKRTAPYDTDTWAVSIGIPTKPSDIGRLPWEFRNEQGAQLRADTDYAHACNAAFDASKGG